RPSLRSVRPCAPSVAPLRPGRTAEPCPGRTAEPSEPCPGRTAEPCPGRASEPCPGRTAEPCPGRAVPGADIGVTAVSQHFLFYCSEETCWLWMLY
uniref:Uncharacterized protein n=1 Tax=Taeniopygia guttata TaxID=59729 RepID=A0A674HEW9_TAEGU